MSDSNAPEHLDEKHGRHRERRIERIKRWVAYIQSDPPPETWGPQQNAVVDAQLESARNVRTSTSHRQHVDDVAAEILAASEESDDESP